MPRRFALNNRLVVAGVTGMALAALLAIIAISMRTSPAQANPASGFASISAGGYHTCGVTTGGGVLCWGWNVDGQLGDGQACGARCPVPVQVSGLTSGVSSVSAGSFHTCARLTTGAAKCWGDNSFGQLGDGTTTRRTTPVNVSSLSNVAEVSAGEMFTCARTAPGATRCWGRNAHGQLGNGTTTDSLTPVSVTGLASGTGDIDAGGNHACAVVTGGAKCWGRNFKGQLGNGTTTSSSVPVNVSTLSSGVAEVSAGFQHSCARTSGAAAKCWGANDAGNLGDGQTCGITCSTPVDVSGLSGGVTSITAGGDSLTDGSGHSCALTATGLVCWGGGFFGELGDGMTSYVLTPQGVFGVPDADAISPGGRHTCALIDGGVKCWGWNTSGQIGNGNVGSEEECDCYTTAQGVVVAVSKATPTPTATPTPCPACPVEFYLDVDTDPTLGASCDTSGGNTSCSAPLGSTLHAKVYLTTLGAGLPYDAVAATIQYSGLTSNGDMEMLGVWPPCVVDAPLSGPGFVNDGCAILFAPSTTYLGVVAEADFTCAADGSLTLVHSSADTLTIDNDGATHYEAGGNEVLTITCVPPAAYPGDTDGDGCPDANEGGTNELTGGERNFLNPWDYFNPSGDGVNRIDDNLMVVNQYFMDDSDGNPGAPPFEPGYNQDTDRTLTGPALWNLGPPNGLQRVDDILNQIKQYFHDCS